MTPTASTLDCVARCPECGNLTCWLSSELPAKYIAKQVTKWIGWGLELERMATDDARGKLKTHAETCSKARKRRTS